MSGVDKKQGGKYTGAVPVKLNVCVVKNCLSKKLSHLAIPVSFFRIPKSLDENQKWLKALSAIETKSQTKDIRVCELHFDENCFERDLEAELTGRPVRRLLKKDSVPSPVIKQTSLEEAILKVKQAREVGTKPSPPATEAPQEQSNLKPEVSSNSALRNRIRQLEELLLNHSKDKLASDRRVARLEARVLKLKTTVSSLRKERRKQKHREYMRKLKRSKSLEKRQERRSWVLDQIQSGRMEKSALSIVNSRKIIQAMRKQ